MRPAYILGGLAALAAVAYFATRRGDDDGFVGDDRGDAASGGGSGEVGGGSAFLGSPDSIGTAPRPLIPIPRGVLDALNTGGRGLGAPLTLPPITPPRIPAPRAFAAFRKRSRGPASAFSSGDSRSFGSLGFK